MNSNISYTPNPMDDDDSEPSNSDQSMNDQERVSAAYTDDDALVISISIAFFIIGSLTNIRKSYRIMNARKQRSLPFGQVRRANRFEFYASILFGSNILALTCNVFFSLSQIFASATVCRWKITAEAVFRFCTPTCVLLLIGIKKPRDEIRKSICKSIVTILMLISWISAATVPYYLYAELDTVQSKMDESVDPSLIAGLIDDQSINDDRLDTMISKCNCTFRSSSKIVSYLIFAYSTLFAFVTPVIALILKFCMLNITPLTSNGPYNVDFRRYIMNLALIWLLCWTPHWTMEIHQFFARISSDQKEKSIPYIAEYILVALPCQIGYTCMPFTCPEIFNDRISRNRIRITSDDLETPKEEFDHDQPIGDQPIGDQPIGERSESDPKSNHCKWMNWGRKRKLTPLNHPMSTLLNITLSLTFPVVAVSCPRRDSPQPKHVRISVTNNSNDYDDDEAETFL